MSKVTNTITQINPFKATDLSLILHFIVYINTFTALQSWHNGSFNVRCDKYWSQ